MGVREGVWEMQLVGQVCGGVRNVEGGPARGHAHPRWPERSDSLAGCQDRDSVSS